MSWTNRASFFSPALKLTAIKAWEGFRGDRYDDTSLYLRYALSAAQMKTRSSTTAWKHGVTIFAASLALLLSLFSVDTALQDGEQSVSMTQGSENKCRVLFPNSL